MKVNSALQLCISIWITGPQPPLFPNEGRCWPDAFLLWWREVRECHKQYCKSKNQRYLNAIHWEPCVSPSPLCAIIFAICLIKCERERGQAFSCRQSHRLMWKQETCWLLIIMWWQDAFVSQTVIPAGQFRASRLLWPHMLIKPNTLWLLGFFEGRLNSIALRVFRSLKRGI